MNPQGPNSANPPTTQVNECILGPDSKLKLEEWKHHQENNLCMMCGKPSVDSEVSPTMLLILNQPQLKNHSEGLKGG